VGTNSSAYDAHHVITASFEAATYKSIKKLDQAQLQVRSETRNASFSLCVCGSIE
jgi:hypothetical protein